jgi:sporulation protein YlmC with PRC-barrel domain
MRILYSKLIDLPVKTRSGELLGEVVDLEIDIDTYSITKLHVKSSNLIRGIFEGMLIIDQSQILEITSEKIIVEDNAKKVKQKKTLNIKLAENKKPVAVATAERE